jgi:hypothetical protein
MKKDKSWTAPETAAFKNIKTGEIPSSTYNYKGENVGKNSGVPSSDYKYKGEKASKGGDIPGTTSDTIVKYRGEKVG